MEGSWWVAGGSLGDIKGTGVMGHHKGYYSHDNDDNEDNNEFFALMVV